MPVSRYVKHRRAVKMLNAIAQNPQNYIIIHYACESFYQTHGGHSARITSIALFDIAGQQTHSFSLHLAAEEMGVDLDAIEDSYDRVEHYMLKQYYEFLALCKNKKFIHWNMLDTNYGFLALEHRYLVLSETYGEADRLIRIPDNDKLNLAAIIRDKYGSNYADNPHMASIIELNNMRPHHFLSGAEEAKAFEEKDFVSLSFSTSSKVRAFARIIFHAANNSLKTKATFKEMYGISPQGIWECMKDKWEFSLVAWIATILLSAYAGNHFFK